MTIYYANPVGRKGSDVHQLVLREMEDGSRIRYIDTPDQWNTRPLNVRWCADNGCFSAKRSIEGIPWDQDGWWNWLVENAPYAHLCDFANAPDVVNMVPTVEDPDPENPEHWRPVGDAAATLERS